MKIVHICISIPYVDNWGYQENLLPDYLQKSGEENHIITSVESLPAYINSNLRNEISAKGNEYNIGEIKVHKIKCKGVTSSTFIPYGLKKKLEEIRPDVIFHHNVSITTLPIVTKYAKKHKCKLFVDNHADEINMSKNKLWVYFNYKVLSRIACRIRRDSVTKFYGVTHSRCEFINKYFGVPEKYIDLLPIGADTDLADRLESNETLRKKYGFAQDDKIVITGGKMGVHKGTIDLVNAIEECNINNVKLILFGKFEDEETEALARSKDFVTIYGWCDRNKTLELLKLANVACWPIHHTTLIEDAIAVETPLVIRMTGTTRHLIKENGAWLKDGNKEELKLELKTVLDKIDNDNEVYLQSCKEMKLSLSYRNIAKRVVEAAK